jgi:hypothetical protein
MKMLFLSPIVLALSTYMAIVYGYLYLLFTTLTLVFEGTYHFSQGAVGLAYVSICISPNLAYPVAFMPRLPHGASSHGIASSNEV